MLRRWLDALLRRDRFEQEMRAELESHLAFRVDDLVSEGLTRQEAERRARIEFGSIEARKDECREARGLRWADALRRNLRHGARVLAASPGFTATAVITLGLCVGANTALFSVVDAVLFRPLPYPEPGRLALVVTSWESGGAAGESDAQDGVAWEAIRDGATRVRAAAFSGWPSGVNLVAGDRVEHVRQQRVGTGFFDVLGVPPMIGREFLPAEDRPGGPALVVLSFPLWRRALGGDPSAVGRTIMLRGEPHTIVGVLPDGFRTTADADLWTPLRPATTGEGSGTNYLVVARLGEGETWAGAEAEMRVVGRTALAGLRLSPGSTANLHLVPLQAGLAASLRPPLILLWAAVGVVLLIGCVNVAGLLLARASGRAREIATRMALGGGRAAIVGQLLTESLLLAALGGLAGTAVGYAGILGIRVFARETLGVWQEVRLDGRVLAATAAVALLTSLAFGLFPALRATGVDLRPALADGGARGIAGPRSRRSRSVLVAAQVALGVVLLVGAGLLVRSLAHLQHLRPGFDPANVLAATASLEDARYRTRDGLVRLIERSLSPIAELPGVRHAAVGLSLPYERALNMPFARPDGETAITAVTYVTPDYFRALGIAVLRGRVFTGADRADTSRVVVVNQAFVADHLDAEEAIGGRIGLGGEPREIVGIVGDVQQQPSWGDYGPFGAVPAVYMPVTQVSDGFVELVHTWFSPSWIVRAAGPRGGLVAGMQRAMEAADPRLPFAGFRGMDDLRAAALGRERFQALAASLLAAIALLLAAVGIAGLIASSVTERTRELGVRIALGATARQAVRAAALPGVALALAGTLAGTLLAQLGVGLIRPFVHGVHPRDALTFAAVAMVLLVVAATASFLPARRIARLDPMQALRDE